MHSYWIVTVFWNRGISIYEHSTKPKTLYRVQNREMVCCYRPCCCVGPQSPFIQIYKRQYTCVYLGVCLSVYVCVNTYGTRWCKMQILQNIILKEQNITKWKKCQPKEVGIKKKREKEKKMRKIEGKSSQHICCVKGFVVVKFVYCSAQVVRIL